MSSVSVLLISQLRPRVGYYADGRATWAGWSRTPPFRAVIFSKPPAVQPFGTVHGRTGGTARKGALIIPFDDNGIAQSSAVHAIGRICTRLIVGSELEKIYVRIIIHAVITSIMLLTLFRQGMGVDGAGAAGSPGYSWCLLTVHISLGPC